MLRLFIKQKIQNVKYIFYNPICSYSPKKDVKKLKQKQLKKLQEISKKHSITDVHWKKMSNSRFFKLGGKDILKYYPSAFEAIKFLRDKDNYNSLKMYWDDNKIHKFLLHIIVKFRIGNIQDLSRLPPNIIIKEGGYALLKGPLYAYLCKKFPYDKWEIARPLLDPTFWNDMKNHKKYLDDICKHFKLEYKQELLFLCSIKLETLGGFLLKDLYTDRVQMLKLLYEDIVFPTLEEFNGWHKGKNMETLLEFIENVLNIQTIYDWKHIEKKHFFQLGGNLLLEKYGTIYNILKELKYKNIDDIGITALPGNISKKYSELEKQKLIINDLSKYFNISSYEDWYNVEYNKIKEYSIHYANTIIGKPQNFLPKIYPHYRWDLFRFPIPYSKWKSDLGLHIDLGYSLVKYYNIKNPYFWTFKTLNDFKLHKAFPCFLCYYSLLDYILMLYPQYRNEILLYSQQDFWKDINNLTSFIKSFIEKNNIKTMYEIYTLDNNVLLQQNGFKQILKEYKSFGNIIKLIYPLREWITAFFNQSDNEKKIIKYYKCALHNYFYNSKIKIELNYKIYDKQKENEQIIPMYLPEYKCIFLYHFEEDYNNYINTFKKNNEKELVNIRLQYDKIIKEKWKKKGYNVVIFPYWSKIDNNTISVRILSSGLKNLEKITKDKRRRDKDLLKIILKPKI